MVTKLGVSNEISSWYIIITILFAYLAFIAFKNTLYYAKLVFKPEEASVFKKYGSPEEILKILEEINNTIEYEDKNLIISKNYISDKKNYSKIVAINDILGIHKLVHKTNFVIDYYQIVITDKYNEEITFNYTRNYEEKVNQLLLLIASKCPHAALGYTAKQREYINNNTIPLQNNNLYCKKCHSPIKSKDKYCHECGNKI